MGTICARIAAPFIFFLFAGVSGAVAADTELTNKVGIELNTVSEAQGGCTLTFLVTNGYSVEIDKLVYETVLFDKAGGVDRLTLFDFGKLPVSTPRVRQFAVPDLACDALGKVLFNGLNTCTAEGLEPEQCGAGMVPSTRTVVEVLG